MTKIWCCRRFQNAEVLKISPTKDNVVEEFAVFLKNCSCCNSSILEILRVDIENNILRPVRLNSKHVYNYLNKVSVLQNLQKKPYQHFRHTKLSKFILNYNEFGKIKNCTNNLSNLNIGKIETNPILNLKTYKLYNEKEKRNCYNN